MIRLIIFVCRRIYHKNVLKSPWIKFPTVTQVNMNKGYIPRDPTKPGDCCFEDRKKKKKKVV